MGRKAKDVVLPDDQMQKLRDMLHNVFVKDDGWQAYQDGKTLDDNPHATGTDDRATWALGWLASKVCAEDASGNPYNITITERT